MIRKALHAVLCAGLMLGASASFEALAQAKGEGARPEVGKPLQAAQSLLRQRKAREAMAEIAKAEAVPNLTPYERQIIAQMKASAASATGANDPTLPTTPTLPNPPTPSRPQALPL